MRRVGQGGKDGARHDCRSHSGKHSLAKRQGGPRQRHRLSSPGQRRLRATRDPLSLPRPDRPPASLSPTEGTEHPATPRSCTAAAGAAERGPQARQYLSPSAGRGRTAAAKLTSARTARLPPTEHARAARACAPAAPATAPARPAVGPAGGRGERALCAAGRGRRDEERGPSAVGRRGPPAAAGELGGGKARGSAVCQPSRKGGPGAGRARSGAGQPAKRGCRDPVGAHLKAVACRRLKNTGQGAEPAACRVCLLFPWQEASGQALKTSIRRCRRDRVPQAR